MPTATTPAAHAPTLTLPRSHFAKLAPASYLATHLTASPPTRPSARAPAAFRPPSCTTSSLTHTAGSAVVRTGSTAVVAGISAETLLARDAASASTAAAPEAPPAALARLGLLVPTVELGTGCSPAHAPQGGGPPSAQAQGLGVRLLRLLLGSGVVGLEDLAIRRAGASGGGEDEDEDAELGQSPDDVVAYWVLYINVVVLSLDGAAALLDAVWAAVYAALRDVRLPHAWWDADREIILCSDAVGDARRLELQGRPVVCTWGVFVVPRGTVRAVIQGKEGQTVEDESDGHAGESFILADPDGFEDEVCDETLSVVIDCDTAATKTRAKIISIMKCGGSSLDLEEMTGLIQNAEKRWKEWDAVLP